MHLQLIEPPGSEPVSLETIKIFLRVDGSDDDNIIQSLIKCAREVVEKHVEQSLISQTWRFTISDHWVKKASPDLLIKSYPNKIRICLPLRPFQKLEGHPKIIKQGKETEYKKYHLVTGLSQGMILLQTRLNEDEALKIDFVSGYGRSENDIPEIFRQVICMIVAELYENRNGKPNHTQSTAVLNDSVVTMLRPYCLRRMI